VTWEDHLQVLKRLEALENRFSLQGQPARETTQGRVYSIFDGFEFEISEYTYLKAMIQDTCQKYCSTILYSLYSIEEPKSIISRVSRKAGEGMVLVFPKIMR